MFCQHNLALSVLQLNKSFKTFLMINFKFEKCLSNILNHNNFIIFNNNLPNNYDFQQYCMVIKTKIISGMIVWDHLYGFALNAFLNIMIFHLVNIVVNKEVLNFKYVKPKIN